MATTRAKRAPAVSQLASLQDAAEELAVSVKTLRRRIADGSLHAYRIGRLIRVDRDEVRRQLLAEVPSAR